jgi:hypothetical protein
MPAGQPKIFKTPEELFSKFKEYLEWVKANPYKWHDFVGKDAEEVWKERQRPITWSGFEGWLASNDIAAHLGHYEQNTDEGYAEFLPTIRAIKRICSQDVIDGALAGVFNQNIAARIEGLADKKEIDKTSRKIKFTDAG